MCLMYLMKCSILTAKVDPGVTTSHDTETTVDGDWASDIATRWSISCGVVRLGGCCLTLCCRTQAPVALGSGGLSYAGVIRVISELSQLKNLLNELGYEVGLKFLIDSWSAKPAVEREGGSILGNLKHDHICRFSGHAPLDNHPMLGKVGTKYSDGGSLTNYDRPEELTGALARLNIQRKVFDTKGEANHDATRKRRCFDECEKTGLFFGAVLSCRMREVTSRCCTNSRRRGMRGDVPSLHSWNPRLDDPFLKCSLKYFGLPRCPESAHPPSKQREHPPGRGSRGPPPR